MRINSNRTAFRTLQPRLANMDEVFTSIRHRQARVNGTRSETGSLDRNPGRCLMEMLQYDPVNRWGGELEPWSLSESD